MFPKRYTISEIAKAVEDLNKDPKAIYLKELGGAINSLSQHSGNTSGYYFTNDSDYEKRWKLIKQIHEAAMEVINTIA
jgi:hypothetical protein